MTTAEQEAREIVFARYIGTENLFREREHHEIEKLVYAALSSRDEALSAAKAEVERLKVLTTTLSEAVVVNDSLGVAGSGFQTCMVCGGGSEPGKGNFKHQGRCPVESAEETADRWYKENHEEIKELEAACKAAEAREAEARKVIERLEADELYYFTAHEKATNIIARWLAKFREGDPCSDAKPTDNEKLSAGIIAGGLSANNLLRDRKTAGIIEETAEKPIGVGELLDAFLSPPSPEPSK